MTSLRQVVAHLDRQSKMRKLFALWQDFQHMDKYRQGLLLHAVDSLFQKQFGSTTDPMHVDMTMFRRPTAPTLNQELSKSNEELGTAFSTEELNQLASYLYKDWNTIVAPSRGHDTIMDLAEPRGS